MDPVTVTCNVCGQLALVHSVRYKYDDDDGHLLRETHSDIECPSCGLRTQVEAYQSEDQP
jgi:rubrerythrin